MLKLALFLFVGLAPAWWSAEARIPRWSLALAEFKRGAPCPANGSTRGSCPGWEVDHIQPLCAHGSDTPGNMQWLTVDDHRNKTRLDMLVCRKQRSPTPA